MTDLRRCRVFAGVLALLFILTISAGCARLRREGVSPEKPEAAATMEAEPPKPLYYDFEDILVPSELKVDRKSSFVYHAPGFRAGVLVLSGQVEVNSLVMFFENNMAKDNWRLLSSFRSPRTIMFFSKPNRTCTINITEKRFKTKVEIWASPIMGGEEATLLK